MQSLEEERISQMQDFMNKYNTHMSVLGPKLVQVSKLCKCRTCIIIEQWNYVSAMCTRMLGSRFCTYVIEL